MLFNSMTLAKPKSRILAWPRFDDKDVGGFYVPMNDAFRMSGIEQHRQSQSRDQEFESVVSLVCSRLFDVLRVAPSR